MPWITVADSDIGGRVEQQDRYLLEQSGDSDCHLLVIADGAGGHKMGGLAAQTAVDCVRENLEALWSSADPESYINTLIIECNKRVLAVGDDDVACTTLVIALIRGDEVFWGHVGDSRFYLVRDREVVVRTADHSVIELQREQAAEDASTIISAPSNKLYMCLGAHADIVPEVASSIVREGDTLLLCSDGLWNQIDIEPLITELSDNPLTIASLNRWIKKARDSKLDCSDNITLIAAQFTSKPRFFPEPLKAIMSLFKKP